MPNIDIELNGRSYSVSCGAGEEKRLLEVVAYVQNKMDEISQRLGNVNENRLLMLTTLLLADELTESKRSGKAAKSAEEDIMVKAVEHLGHRVARISERMSGHA